MAVGALTAHGIAVFANPRISRLLAHSLAHSLARSPATFLTRRLARPILQGDTLSLESIPNHSETPSCEYACLPDEDRKTPTENAAAKGGAGNGDAAAAALVSLEKPEAPSGEKRQRVRPRRNKPKVKWPETDAVGKREQKAAAAFGDVTNVDRTED